MSIAERRDVLPSVVRGRYSQWWEGTLDSAIIQLVVEQQAWDPWRLAHNWDDVAGVLEAFEEYVAVTRFELDAFPQFNVNFGPGIVATALGADAKVMPDTVWLQRNPPLQEEDEVSWDFGNEWYARCLAVTEYAARRGAGRYAVGIPSHSGSLDLLCFLRHPEQVFLDMKKAPERVMRWMRSITEFWLESYWKFHHTVLRHQTFAGTAMGLWAPGAWSYVQADAAAMISPEDFVQFVMPDLLRITRELDYTIYHLDGPGQIRHLDHLLALPDLDGIEWTPGAGEEGPAAPKWFPLLRRILAAGKRVVLQAVEPAAIPPLLDAIGTRNVLIRSWTRDPTWVERLRGYCK